MKKILSVIFATSTIFALSSCGNEARDEIFGSIPTEEDFYFTNQLTFADTNSYIPRDSEGNLAGCFSNDAVALAEVVNVFDGDTVNFRQVSNGQTFQVRFEFVDAPEVGSNPEAWGRASQEFVRDLLVGNYVILDALDRPLGNRMDNHDRWMSLVWFFTGGEDGDRNDLSQFRLLQLKLIESSLAEVSIGVLPVNHGTRYIFNANPNTQPELFYTFEHQLGALSVPDLLSIAALRTETLGLRVLGNQSDPNFAENGMNPVGTTLENIINDFDYYADRGTVIEVTGRVTEVVSRQINIQCADGYAIAISMNIHTSSHVAGTYASRPLVRLGDTINVIGRLNTFNGRRQIVDVQVTDTPRPTPPIGRPRQGIIVVTDPAKQIGEIEALNINAHIAEFQDEIRAKYAESKYPADLNELINYRTRRELERQAGRLVKFTASSSGNMHNNAQTLGGGDFTLNTNFNWQVGGNAANYWMNIRVLNHATRIRTGFLAEHFGPIGTSLTIIGVLDRHHDSFQVSVGNNVLQDQRPEWQVPVTINPATPASANIVSQVQHEITLPRNNATLFNLRGL